MKFQELMAELRGSILRDSSALQSGPSDHFWDDDTLARYINDAQLRFARRTLCIRDFTTPEVVEVSLATGIKDYVLHPSVRFVISARFGSVALGRITTPLASSIVNPSVDFWDNSYSANPGSPRAFYTDVGFDVDTREHPIVFTVYPTPSATENGAIINLRVCRLPLKHFSMDADMLDMDCEIPTERQLDMLEWAAWLALRNWDVDSEDRRKAEDHKNRFNDAVKEARLEVTKEIFQPYTWLFGSGGFTWSE